jgi:hypothetical protein
VNNGEQFPEERIQYQNLFECENHVFETIYKRYFPKEHAEMDYQKYSEEMREIRVLALLFAAQIFADKQ